MKANQFALYVLVGSAFANASFADDDSNFEQNAQNKNIWAKYCVGKQKSAEVPEVNYSDALVKAAAKKLGQVADMSFYYYSGPLKAYGLNKLKEADLPSGATSVKAHQFLVQLCGEFRDRPKMIEEKLNWIGNLFYLPGTAQKAIPATVDNVWSKVSAHSYRPYLDFSQSLYEARQEARNPDSIQVGNETVDAPTPGQLVCETKYIFSQYVSKKLDFPGLDAYEAGYAKFKKNCSADDLDYYYDFRGDSNFKPYSPESNGMIWYSSSVTGHCTSTTTGDGKAPCKEYFTAPFAARFNAARAGMAAWLFYKDEFESTFGSEGMATTIIPNDDPANKPFTFAEMTSNNQLLSSWLKLDAYADDDMGFNALAKLGTKAADQSFTYQRLRNAVDRHTDWYSSRFDDKRGLTRDQAYSPFVASSYVMEASDGFTAPGVTVGGAGDGRKHWMFVFRVKKDNWYNTASIAAGKKLDFTKNWFDETSLGTNNLAKSERAWDRMGTALEGEFDSILYLHNIDTSGTVVGTEGEQ